MSPNLRRYGMLAIALGLLTATAGRVQAQGFGMIPNQPVVNNPNFFLNPGLAQAQFLYNLQARQVLANPFSNPYLLPSPVVAPANPLIDPYTGGGNIYTPGMGGYDNPYRGYYESPQGGFLRGAADVMRAYGTVITSQEQARIMREAARQARLETEKKRFELERWIKENTPTLTEEQLKIQKQVLKKYQNMSNPYEIWAGASLNVLLDDLRKYPGKRASVEPIHLPENVLRHLNVTKSFGNLGLLRDDGRFKWPPGLQDLVPADKQKDIEVYAETVVNKARNGKIETNVLRDLKAELEKISDNLFRKVNDMPTPQYMEAKKFLRDFEDATRAIEKGDATAYFEFQAFVAKAPSVQEITDFMVRNGLRFAPATQGDEAAYQAMHSAIAAYDVAVNTQLASAVTPPPKDQ